MKTRKQQIEELLADEPNDAFLRYGLAMEYVSEGNDEEAVRRFRELLDATPDYVPAYLLLGQTLVRLGRPAEVREVLTRGIAVARREGNDHAREEMQGLMEGL